MRCQLQPPKLQQVRFAQVEFALWNEWSWKQRGFACRMTHSAFLSSATLGMSFLCTGSSRSSFYFLHCELSTWEGKGTGLREAEKSLDPLLHCGSSRQWNYTPIKHQQHKPEPAPSCARTICLFPVGQDIITSLLHRWGVGNAWNFCPFS